MDAGCCKASRGVRRKDHVDGFLNPGWIEHSNERMNVLELTAYDIEAGRRIHPTVHKGHKHGGEDTADRDDDARKKMKPARYTLPTI